MHTTTHSQTCNKLCVSGTDLEDFSKARRASTRSTDGPLKPSASSVHAVRAPVFQRMGEHMGLLGSRGWGASGARCSPGVGMRSV